MAPYVFKSSVSCETSTSLPPEKTLYKVEIVWRNVVLFVLLHASAVYGFYLMLFSAKWATVIWTIALYHMNGLGVTAGAHRLWSHRSYKAKYPLQILLTIFNCLAFQNSIYEWSRDHRLHHKYSETNADPHNATRGFFFSHIGWLLCKKHPDIKEKGKGIDLSDLKSNPIVMFQHRHYLKLMPLTCFVLPTVIPMYFWDESFINSWFVPTMFRYCCFLNMTWFVNSAAHLWGNKKPYDSTINPNENFAVAIGAIGEGWHNYHHVFPWDYKAAELGDYKMNITTAFIDFMAKIGQAYDCKIVHNSVIRSRMQRTGALAESLPQKKPIEEITHPWCLEDEAETVCNQSVESPKQKKAPDEWGWTLKKSGLDPVATLQPPAPPALLQPVSCKCTKNSLRNCGCMKAGLNFSSLCLHCEGTCNNVAVVRENLVDEEVEQANFLPTVPEDEEI